MLESSKKRIVKIFKKLKHIILALFPSKLGLDRLRKKNKNIRPEFGSYSTRAIKYQKKIMKKLIKLKNIIPALFQMKPG